MSSEILKTLMNLFLYRKLKVADARLHSKIERGDQEDSDGGVL